MLYHSTREPNKEERLCSFLNVLLKGLASDGGLYVPTSYSSMYIEERLWRYFSYQELASRLYRWFISDVPYSIIRKLVRTVYNERFPLSYYNNHSGSCPVGYVVATNDNVPIYMLRLSNGSSLSFKDIAMQLLCGFFETILGSSSVNIISATSGDTGSSVCTAFQFCKRSRLFVYSPLKSISEYQAEQMYSHLSINAFNICFNGKFDCCQDIVKRLLCKNRSNNGTANSINWVRLLFQTTYYFSSYFRVTIASKEYVTFLIPSGNFGNAFAGFISKTMGLPIRRIIIATNENNVLEEFFKAGTYQVRKASSLLSTNTPSMDISKASNLERLLLELLNRNSNILFKVFQQIQYFGLVRLLNYISYRSIKRLGISAESTTGSERHMIVQYIYKRCGLLIDTHSANGAKAILLLKHSNPIRDVKIILETAQALKLKDSLQDMIGSNYSFLTQRRVRRLRVMFPCVTHVKQVMLLRTVLLGC
ncbi:threonine synthase [Candidatus Tremblaya phenacola]|uniref:Threonine synthase n=2 Tax=Candidatus Tremblayella phenacoccinincola TaxID=1010676 RepID=A0A2G0V6Z9_9PROT|nr:threonine synthase [Candidatus Tremblaya phenacola]PHN16254.1 Threonine synthase [Candidatus Tremblaya phenacola]